VRAASPLAFALTVAASACGARTALDLTSPVSGGPATATSTGFGTAPTTATGTGSVTVTGMDASSVDSAADAGLDAIADAAGDGSPCATFQSEPVWTPMSASFDLGFGYSGAGGGDFHFSEAAGTLSGTLDGPTCPADAGYICIAGLVYLSQAQIDAIVAQAQAIQTLCEPDCNTDTGGTNMSVKGAAPDASATAYEGCSYYAGSPPIETEAGVRYMDVTKANGLETTLSDLIVAACEPDGGGPNPNTCVPLNADGGVLAVDDGD
jgi:hypothetical protein